MAAWRSPAPSKRPIAGLPKPISGRVMELRDHLPERWREAFAGVPRVHVTRVHRLSGVRELIRPHRLG